MNEEKNNIGIGNTGVNNSLPPMGTVQVGTNMNTNSVQDKYGLPPISNFTNFNNSYETPTVDNNTSVFDLMDQFESVNNGNVSNQNSINNTPVMPQMNITNNPVVNTASVNNEQFKGDNQVIPNIPVANNNSNTVSNQTPINNMESPFSMFSGNSDISNRTSIPTINNPVNNNLNSVGEINQNTNSDPLNIFGGSINNNVQDVSTVNQINSQKEIAIPSINPMNEQSNVGVFQDVPSHNEVSSINPINVESNVVTPQELPNENNVVNQLQPEINIPLVNSVANNNVVSSVNSMDVQRNVGVPQDISSQNNMVNEINTPQVNNIVNNNELSSVAPMNEQGNNQQANDNAQNYNLNDTMDNNQVVEIPTTSISDIENSSGFDVDTTNIGFNTNNSNDDVEELITNFDNNTSINADTKDTVVANNENANIDKSGKPKKKKKKKALFIILLIITLLIVGAVAILSYFMFFKEDKLVCGLQDYSNEQFILDESMVMRFKGNSLSTANFTHSLTFDSDHLDKKDSYLEELKNQYQGLGFNVSFVENEDGFDINMNFTKKELESWYGTSLKNSSKSQMKKEMRESGYTCK